MYPLTVTFVPSVPLTPKKGVLMPRSPRVYCESSVYHVVLRGNARMIIFHEEADYYIFRKLMFDCAKRYQASIYTYCMMDNHVHILLKCKNLSEYMRDLSGSYSKIYTSRYAVEGHLYQDRFYSAPVESEAYFFYALRYILHNPEAAGICQWQNYKYSNAKDFLYIGQSEIASSLAEIVGGTSALKNFLNQKDPASATLEYEPGINRRRTDAEVIEIIDKILQEWNNSHCSVNSEKSYPIKVNLFNLKQLERPVRTEILKLFLLQGIPINQLSRITGISRKIISRVTEKGQK